MKTLNVVRTMAVGALLAGGAVIAQSSTKLTGVVSDQMCGAKHMMDGGAAKCTRACVKQGSPYALVVGSKVYTLKGHSAELDKLAGKSATVQGKLSGNTLDVSSVTAGK
jgi:pentose-5-phosphate-3-epimerase